MIEASIVHAMQHDAWKEEAIDVTAKYARLTRVVVPRARQTAERASMRRAICKMYSYCYECIILLRSIHFLFAPFLIACIPSRITVPAFVEPVSHMLLHALHLSLHVR